jgi:hypothetical protein
LLIPSCGWSRKLTTSLALQLAAAKLDSEADAVSTEEADAPAMVA